MEFKTEFSDSYKYLVRQNANPKVWKVTYTLHANDEHTFWRVIHQINLNTYTSPVERVPSTMLYDPREMYLFKKDLMAIGFERTIVVPEATKSYSFVEFCYISEERLVANADFDRANYKDRLTNATN